MKTCAVLVLLLLVSFPLMAAEKQATAILLDNSKSIPPADFQKSKDLMGNLYEQLSGTKLLYVFGNEMRKIDREELASVQATESYTMIYDAAYDAAQNLSSVDAERKGIIIISDGIDTKSATILEDIVRFANDQNISVYGVGVGKANRKVLERMARLTGGRYMELGGPGQVSQLQESLTAQKKIAKKNEPQAAAVQHPSPSLPVVNPPAVAVPVPEEPPSSGFSFGWILLGVLALVIVGGGLLVVARSYRSETRVCPTCGKSLEPYQTICSICSVPETIQIKKPAAPSDGTQEIGIEQDVPAIPMELLEKKPVTEEMLSKTFVLMETPMLVVRKGKNLGQTFSLNRAFPVSIGRSRVNEIRLDDITISSQHCRIIPENGKHVLYDLSSTNGTFLNDKKVNRSVLKEGDTIRIGETQFLFKIEQHRT
jgi:hypothetical protein